MHHAAAIFQAMFAHYGLAAVFVVLLLENFGLPLPGELALLYSGYHMRVYGGFGWLALIATATLACVAGQVIGYALGRYAAGVAQRLIPQRGRRRVRFEIFFQRHGVWTVVVARFVAGLRMLAGLLAGLGHMPWRIFLTASTLGALAWVAIMTALGAALGAHAATLTRLVGRLDIVVLVAAAVIIAAAWRHLAHE